MTSISTIKQNSEGARAINKAHRLGFFNHWVRGIIRWRPLGLSLGERDNLEETVGVIIG